MRQLQQLTTARGITPLIARRQALQKPKPVRSTAAILAQGVTLVQVQEAVKRLRPRIERTEMDRTEMERTEMDRTDIEQG